MSVVLGNKTLSVPLIQGGMGVGISLGNLSGTVAKYGAMGVIASVGIGYRETDYGTDSLMANKRALQKEYEKARTISEGNGLLAVNIMYAITQYKEMASWASQLGFDAIIMGAGLPTDLPKYVDSDILLAPIVSGKRALSLILRSWKKKFQRLPDFVVVEGPQAGGHLGFSKEEAETGSLFSIIEEVISYLEKESISVPVFAAGGIFSHGDYKKALSKKAAGVQVGTRFIVTEECDAPDSFKTYLLEHKKPVVIHSPVGMPARAVESSFTKKILKQRVPSTHCIRCLRICDPKTTQFCISDALTAAIRGDTERGLFFAGKNFPRLTKIQTVKEVIEEIVGEKVE